ncbi:hypothetical protein A3H38_01735 [candidate division WOR-1 bacterium RIFCSPLOWO2_02_FULL_46_20]|uniref:Uncharacterized protein n=1 Tax=candidate division WOR-1 bacterium RIFCSPLOWO2_02_FULL_46_20 TaxID=1802567 RepID=A0A1F4RH68_UNCSA|nr:MAG: hypothetical protein A3J44_03750 [candidate division WOR-1 bacterium RIFCSPHIGHO2_02_FULL_45_12]OGC07510.1 MAG: hypothetical protein A3H38_01735 [candidate division WOR-1 bacterium RIFCSPLOWO2_02_FULL_46_20]
MEIFIPRARRIRLQSHDPHVFKRPVLDDSGEYALRIKIGRSKIRVRKQGAAFQLMPLSKTKKFRRDST